MWCPRPLLLFMPHCDRALYEVRALSTEFGLEAVLSDLVKGQDGFQRSPQLFEGFGGGGAAGKLL